MNNPPYIYIKLSMYEFNGVGKRPGCLCVKLSHILGPLPPTLAAPSYCNCKHYSIYSLTLNCLNTNIFTP